MVQLNNRQQGARSGHCRRLQDAAAQQHVLKGMGVHVGLKVLQELPPGGWLRLIPEGARLRAAKSVDGG